MTQTTDDGGIAAFYIIPTSKYNVSFTKAGYTISSMVLVPTEDEYIVYATNTTAPGAGTFFEQGVSELMAVS